MIRSVLVALLLLPSVAFAQTGIPQARPESFLQQMVGSLAGNVASLQAELANAQAALAQAKHDGDQMKAELDKAKAELAKTKKDLEHATTEPVKK